MISGYSNNNYSNPSYQAPSLQTAGSSTSSASSTQTQQAPSDTTIKVASVLTSIWNGLVNAVKTFFSWLGGLFGSHSSSTTTSSGSELTPQQAAIAQQYQLLATASNVAAFVTEVQSYQNDGALGPGSTNTTAISDLQKALDKLGYSLPVSGQYDTATQQAVLQFKETNGLHQTYEAANGTWAINEYADPQTLQLVMSKLQQAMSGQAPSSSSTSAPTYSNTPTSSSATAPTSTSSTTPTSSQPSVNYAAIAQQYALLDTAANVNAFLAEIKAYVSDGTLGPGSTNSTAVSDLQKALDKLGYSVPVTSKFDSATSQAVMAFKKANGIHQTYQAADGSWAVNEYADPQTLSAIMQKLQATMQPASTSTSTPSSYPSSNSASSTPSGQPSVNYAAIAQQYGLLDTTANVNAFISEIKGYQSGNALGPGSTKTSAIRDLQTALSKLGYHVSVDGQYDSATSQAVMAFKRSAGLHQTYKAQDGNWAVNEYADSQTLSLLMQKLQQQAAAHPAYAAPTQVASASIPIAATSVSSPIPVESTSVYAAPSSALTAQQGALARQYNLYPTVANVDSFMNEVHSYSTDGTLGPGSTQTSAIRDLQTALGRFGYSVQVDGTYDQATANAVIAFKKSNGLHQSYRATDGNWAVNEYADRNTMIAIMSKLQAAAGKAG